MKELYVNRIKQVKIRNYKKRLAEKYSFLGVSEINNGDDDPEDITFCKMAHNTDDGEYLQVNIFDNTLSSYLSDEWINCKSKQMIKENLSIFEGSEKIVFTANHRSEQFRIKCDADKFIEFFDDIEDISFYPIIFEENHNRVLSTMRLEYELELYIWVDKYSQAP